MKREDLFEAIGHVDENLLDENVIPDAPAVWRWISRITTAAACTAVILGTAVWAHMHRTPPEQLPTQTTEGSAHLASGEPVTHSDEHDPPVTETSAASESFEHTVEQTETAVSTEQTKAVETSSTENDSIISDIPWKAAYQQCVENLELIKLKQNNWESDMETTGYSYELLDIDSNGIPELVASDETTVNLYLFTDNMMYEVFEGAPLYSYMYIEGENTIILWVSSQDGTNDWFSVYYLSQETHQLEVSYSLEILYPNTEEEEEVANDVDYASDTDTNINTSMPIGITAPRYFLGNAEISEEQAAPYLEMLHNDNPIICGTLGYQEILEKIRYY